MQSGNEISPVYVILQNKFFIKKFYKNLQRILCKKYSVEVSMLFGQILIDLLLHI